MTPTVSISVVVHQQAHLVLGLLKDLNGCRDITLEVIVTVNMPETIPFTADEFNFPLTISRNRHPKGFGANHNAAFRKVQGRFFCVLNPDIRLRKNPFSELIAVFTNRDVAVAAPVIKNIRGSNEDNIRHFPSPLNIIAKSLGKWPRIEYPRQSTPFSAEWAAGMFLLFKSRIFSEIDGFNPRYYLYYEDVEICARLKLAGYAVMACPTDAVIHNARRESHRNLRYMKWHLQSMAQFFLSRTYRRVKALKSSISTAG
ncbi:MAG: glycosyltransferase family 2 protein [Desulfobacterales bacterium]|nr:glycosyltransferase family 2 protein [Desulfobacterales bacterium]